jgi:hypothetical protein
MAEWLKWIGIVVALLVVLFVGVGFLLPSEYHVDRSVVINADPERIHELVGDLKNWPEWTPWKLIDPTIQTVYGDRTSGVGAYQSWTGESGSGELTFTAWDPDRGVLYDLSFDEGAYSSVGSITYEEARGGTKVTWTMDGDSGMNIIGRYFGLMIDSFVGPQFQRGLDRLKAKVESV